MNKYFGEGHYGHGEVIASSACISGIICSIFQVNEKVNREMGKLQAKLEKLCYVPVSKDEVTRQEAVIVSITEEIEGLKKTAARKFGAKDRALAKMAGTDYDAMKAALDLEKQETEKAQKRLDILLKEKDAMGMMLSGHPADGFGSEEENGCMKLSEAVPAENGSVMGQMTCLRIVRKKSDGRQMAFFNLDMPDGEIQACCFAKEYEAYFDFIRENAVIKISGRISGIEDDFSGRDEKMQIIAKSVMQLAPKQKEIIVYGSETTKEGWKKFRKRLSAYEMEGGVPLMLFNLVLNRFQPTGMSVSKDILESPYFQAEM